MSNDRYSALRRRFLSLGLTGAIAGTAGCSGIVDVETGGNSESETDDTGAPSADIDAASFTFEYDSEAQQVEIVFNGGAGITAGNIRVQHTSGKEVLWAELGSTTAPPDEEISQGATAVLGPNVLNWGVPVTEDEMVRLIYVGHETPATLERYSPPETTESESTVPASISSFSIESQSDQRLKVSFTSSKQLETITVSVFGPKDTTLTESDFTEIQTGDGNYTYEASYGASSDGEFEATLDDAVDVNGNGSLNGQSISDTTAVSSKDTTSPSISAFSIANPSGQTLRTSFESDEQLSTIRVSITGAESVSLTRSNFSETNTNNETYTYEATYQASSDGDYNATLDGAVDADGNDGADSQSVSASVITTEDWDFEEDFEQYSIGSSLTDIEGWTENRREEAGFEVENAASGLDTQQALGSTQDSGNWKVSAYNEQITAWSYPENGFELRGVIFTGSDDNAVRLQLQAENTGGPRINIDNTPYGGTGIRYVDFDKNKTKIDDITSGAYEVRIIGKTDQTLTVSYRPISKSEWSNYQTSTDYIGTIKGVRILMNNGGQIDKLRLRKR